MTTTVWRMSRPRRGNRWGHDISLTLRRPRPFGTAGAAVSDEERLAQLGYTQVLARRMSAFSNYAVSFTIISVLSGCLTLYLFGMNTAARP